MVKYLKTFTSNNERQTFESSSNYLEPYVSIVETNEGGGISVLSYNLIPSIIITMKDSSVKKLYNTNILSSGEIQKFYPGINLKNITDVKLSDGIVEIKSYLFMNNLVSINIPNSVKKIGSQAFNYCLKLRSISLPASITSLRGTEFEMCSSLTSVTLTDSITYINLTSFNRTNIRELRIMGKKNISHLLTSDLTDNLTELYVDASLVETYKTYRDSISKTFEVKPLT